MKNQNEIQIILAESDSYFRNRLSRVLTELSTLAWGDNYTLILANTSEELKEKVSSSTNLVLIDSSLFLNEGQDFINTLYKQNETCKYVFLISTYEEFCIKTFIQIISANKKLEMLGFIIKTNSPIDLIYVILGSVINRLEV